MSDQPLSARKPRLSKGVIQNTIAGTPSDFRTSIRSTIDEVIAQSGIKLASMSKNDRDTLIELILDVVLENIETTPNKEGDAHNNNSIDANKVASKSNVEVEETIWKGSPLLSFNEHYHLTNERIRVISGFWSKKFEEVDLIFIQDIQQNRSFGQILLNRGDITIFTSDPNHQKIKLKNIWQSEKAHEYLRRAMLQARKRHGLTYFTERKIGAVNGAP